MLNRRNSFGMDILPLVALMLEKLDLNKFWELNGKKFACRLMRMVYFRRKDITYQ